EGSAEHAPSSVILKMGHLDSAGRSAYANHREIAFYRDIAPVVLDGLVPRCFESVEATDTSAWHLLLEDLTDSHFIATQWPLPPTARSGALLARALSFASQPDNYPRRCAFMELLPAPTWRRGRPADRLGILEHRHRN